MGAVGTHRGAAVSRGSAAVTGRRVGWGSGGGGGGGGLCLRPDWGLLGPIEIPLPWGGALGTPLSAGGQELARGARLGGDVGGPAVTGVCWDPRCRGSGGGGGAAGGQGPTQSTRPMWGRWGDPITAGGQGRGLLVSPSLGVWQLWGHWGCCWRPVVVSLICCRWMLRVYRDSMSQGAQWGSGPWWGPLGTQEVLLSPGDHNRVPGGAGGGLKETQLASRDRGLLGCPMVGCLAELWAVGHPWGAPPSPPEWVPPQDPTELRGGPAPPATPPHPRQWVGTLGTSPIGD